MLQIHRVRTLDQIRSFLDELAYALSDNDATRQLNEAREQLFQSIHNAEATAA